MSNAGGLLLRLTMGVSGECALKPKPTPDPGAGGPIVMPPQFRAKLQTLLAGHGQASTPQHLGDGGADELRGSSDQWKSASRFVPPLLGVRQKHCSSSRQTLTKRAAEQAAPGNRPSATLSDANASVAAPCESQWQMVALQAPVRPSDGLYPNQEWEAAGREGGQPCEVGPEMLLAQNAGQRTAPLIPQKPFEAAHEREPKAIDGSRAEQHPVLAQQATADDEKAAGTAGTEAKSEQPADGNESVQKAAPVFGPLPRSSFSDLPRLRESPVKQTEGNRGRGSAEKPRGLEPNDEHKMRRFEGRPSLLAFAESMRHSMQAAGSAATRPPSEGRAVPRGFGEQAPSLFRAPAGSPQIAGHLEFVPQLANARETKESAQTVGEATRTILGALDAKASASVPIWTHTQENFAEAGFEDPSMGWVRVRAQADATGVHAAVIPASIDAKEALSGHLSGLGTFLSEHHAPVDTWTLVAPEAAPRIGSALQAGESASGRENSQRHESGQREPTLENRTGRRASEESPPRITTFDPSWVSATGTGSYISLIA